MGAEQSEGWPQILTTGTRTHFPAVAVWPWRFEYLRAGFLRKWGCPSVPTGGGEVCVHRHVMTRAEPGPQAPLSSGHMESILG